MSDWKQTSGLPFWPLQSQPSHAQQSAAVRQTAPESPQQGVPNPFPQMRVASQQMSVEDEQRPLLGMQGGGGGGGGDGTSPPVGRVSPVGPVDRVDTVPRVGPVGPVGPVSPVGPV